MTLLSDSEIKEHMKHGSIVISPFREERLNTDSYDLELGPHFWRFSNQPTRFPSRLEDGAGFVHQYAEDGFISLGAGERVLGHTVEIAGGRSALIEEYDDITDKMVPSKKVSVTTSLHATSTAGRHGISACLCAGWGDVGFCNIWVLEITNHTNSRMILPVGSIICQISFQQVTPPSKDYTDITGNYQPKLTDVEEIRRAWTPESMLPKKLKKRETWREFKW